MASPVCLYMYYCWRSSYQEERDRFQLIWLTQLYCYAFPKPGLGFQMSYGMVFFGVQWVKGWWFILLILVKLLAITIYTCLFIMPYLIYWTVNKGSGSSVLFLICYVNQKVGDQIVASLSVCPKWMVSRWSIYFASKCIIYFCVDIIYHKIQVKFAFHYGGRYISRAIPIKNGAVIAVIVW